VGRYGVYEAFTLHSDKTLAGHTHMNKVGAKFPASVSEWCPDDAFGECRLGGVDAHSLYRINSSSEIPTNFQVTDNHLQQVLPDSTLDQEAQNGNLFMLDYTIMRKVLPASYREGFVPAPFGLFVWNSNKLQPVAIQLDPDPTAYPVYGPNDGLQWQAAKVFLQIGASTIHTFGSHEYSKYLS
jgi:hypothetical protein